jgi:hypothetical protein
MSEVYGNPIGNLVASVRVTALGAITRPSFGVASVALVAHVLTITLSNLIDPTDANIMVTVREATSAGLTVAHISDSQIEVRGFTDADAPVDVAFGLMVFRKAVG